MDTGCLEVAAPEKELIEVLKTCEGYVLGPYRGPGGATCLTFEVGGELRSVSVSEWEDNLTALYSRESEVSDFLPNLTEELKAKGIVIDHAYFGDLDRVS